MLWHCWVLVRSGPAHPDHLRLDPATSCGLAAQVARDSPGGRLSPKLDDIESNQSQTTARPQPGGGSVRLDTLKFAANLLTMSDVTTSDIQSREDRRAELMELNKRDLAEMLRSTFRLSARPTLSQVMNAYTKPQIIERLL